MIQLHQNFSDGVTPVAAHHPRISVIMPVYNVEAYVAEAIDSVLAQSFGDWELIIVDDGGTDRSLDICASYADPRIRIIAQANRGLAGARNTAINAAHGEYIALLDSDDRWAPEKLALHLIHLDNRPTVGVSYSASRFINADGQPLRQSQRPKLACVSPSDVIARNPVGNGSAAVIRRTALDAIAFPHPTEAGRTCFFDESFRQSEDVELWVRMALTSGYEFDGIAPALTDYRIIPGGLSANVVRQFETWERMVEKVRSYAPGFVAEHGARARAYELRYLARRSVQLGDGGFAVSLIAQSLKSSMRPLWEEPRRTLVTIGAAVAARMMPPSAFAALAARWTGGRIVA